MRLLTSKLLILLKLTSGTSDTLFATSDNGGDCLSGWTKVTGKTQCDPPTDLTNSISCSSSGLSVTIKPSHVFDDYTSIPDTILSTLKVQIEGSSGSYQDFITFGSDNTGLEGTAQWSSISPKLHSTNDKIFMTYKLKVDNPTISFGSTSIYTTENVNEFYIRCSMKKAVTVTSSAVTMETIELGSATNGTAASEIDTSSIFSLSTYSDNTYSTTRDTFEIGSSVYAKVDASNMANMPNGIGWEVNECKAVGDDNTHKMPIFEAAGTCINPYLDVDSDPTTDTGRQFKFKAFTFDTANVDDSIEITCSIKLGKTGGGDDYSDTGDTCDALLVTATVE